MAGTKIEIAGRAHIEPWVRLRAELWPEVSLSEHRSEVIRSLSPSETDIVAFVALTQAGEVVGFAEASVRHDYVNGCDTSPVAFLEGIHVTAAHRRSGVARALCEAVETWGRRRACCELGSDALIDNSASHAFHIRVGFEERERVVCFRKRI